MAEFWLDLGHGHKRRFWRRRWDPGEPNSKHEGESSAGAAFQGALVSLYPKPRTKIPKIHKTQGVLILCEYIWQLKQTLNTDKR